MGQSVSSSSSSCAPDGLATVLARVEERLSKLESQIENREFFSLSVLLEQPDGSTFSTLRDQFKAFQVEIRFLKMFLDMIDKLNDGFWFELTSPLLPQIEAGIDGISSEFLIAGENFENVSKLILVLTDSLEKVELLKPLVEEFCGNLRINNVLPVKMHHSIWDSHYSWNGFLESIRGNIWDSYHYWDGTLSEKADLQQTDPLPLFIQIKAFLDRLSCLTNFSESVSSSWTCDSYLKYLRIHAGALAIRAVNLSCLCWLRGRKMNECMAEEMANAFSNLQQEADPASQKFLHMILRFLGTVRQHGYITHPVDMLIHHLLHINREYPFFVEISELIKSFIEVREEYEKDVERLLPDVAAVFRQAGSLEVQNSLSKAGGGGPADLVHFRLVAMLRLLRTEIFLIEILNHRDLSTKGISHHFFHAAPSLDKIARGHLGVLHLQSKFLHHKTADPLEDNLDFWKQVYMLSGEVGDKLQLLSRSFNAGKITRYALRFLLLKWLTSILVFKAEAYLIDLLNSNGSLILQVKDQIRALKSLVASITNMPNKLIFLDLTKVNKDEILILMLTESVTRQVLSLYHSFHTAQLTGGVMELSNLLSGLIEKTTQVIDEIDVQLPNIKFPKTNGLGFIDFLLIKLRELLEYRSGSIFVEQHIGERLKYESGSMTFVMQRIKLILENLGFLRSLLGEQAFKHQEFKELRILVKDAAYRVELIIDSIVIGSGSQRNNLSWLYHVSENIRHIKMQVTEFKENTRNRGVRNGVHTMRHEISQASTSGIDEDVAVLNDKQQLRGDQFTRGSSHRHMGREISQTSTFEISEDEEVLNHWQQVIGDQLTRGSLHRDMGHEISQTSTFEISEDVAVLKDQQQVIVARLTTGSSHRYMGHEISQSCISEISEVAALLNDREPVTGRFTRGSSQRDMECEIDEDVVVLKNQKEVIADQLTRGSSYRDMGSEISLTSTVDFNEDVELLNHQQQEIIDQLRRGSWQKDVGHEISQTTTFEITEDVVALNDQQQEMVSQLTRGSPQRDLEWQKDVGHEISQISTFEINEDVVVLNDQQQVIVDRLTRGSLQRDVVSIVGMAGIGKTTLANRVYHDPEVVYYFHIRAWCCVSQVYTKRELLIEILRHIIELTDSILMMTNEDLEFVLYKHLKRCRYLIFMDDVWSIGVWDDLKSSFPDDENGSRILITSRLHDVVSKVTLELDLLDLRPLSDDESWELLKMKIFPKAGCPEELLDVGKEIARNCKGLPLSIVTIAGLLRGTYMKPDSWKQIAESLNSVIVIDPQSRCMDILELSYKNLPDHLKACFLYFGAFQEDKEIPVRRLVWLWMAEGFILKRDSRSLEDLAEDYLRDLIARSLITVAKRSSDGRVKACRVHDMVRNLCLLKAKQENFLELVTSKDEPYASFDDIVDFDDFDHSNSMTYKEHRLCISMSRQNFVMSRPSGPYVRSLLFFATTDAYPRCPYNVSFISDNFKLLKVLDLESINMGSSFADGIDLLLQLSYLAVSGDIDSIPSSLTNLRNLETLLVKGLKGKVILPDSIWQMTRLRHVHVNNHVAFTLKNIRTGRSYQLSNLVSLSTPSLSYGEHAEAILSRLPNLRNLCCIFSKSRDNSTECNQFPRLAHLMQLESLKVIYHGRTINTGELNFPLSLKKLSLSNFFLRWDHISTIGRQENLEVLKLLAITFEDTRWEMTEEEFPKLKFLKLDSLNIIEWNASCDHLPNLHQLVLRKCENLKELPMDFVNIPTLQIIEVQQCGDSVEESVRRLKEEQLEYGIEDLKVFINH